MRPKLPCWKAPGPLVSHTSQTRKPGEKPPTSRDFGRVDPRLSRGSGQHLRPLGRAARRGRTGRCASRVQGTASSGWGWGSELTAGRGSGEGRPIAPSGRGPAPGARAERGRRHSASPPHPRARPGPPPAAAARVPRNPWAAGAESWGGLGRARPSPSPSRAERGSRKPRVTSLPARWRREWGPQPPRRPRPERVTHSISPPRSVGPRGRAAGARGEYRRAGGLRPGGLGRTARGRLHRRGHRPARGCLLSARRRARGVGWARAPPPPRFARAPSRRLPPPAAARLRLLPAAAAAAAPRSPGVCPPGPPEPPAAPTHSFHLGAGLILRPSQSGVGLGRSLAAIHPTPARLLVRRVSEWGQIARGKSRRPLRGPRPYCGRKDPQTACGSNWGRASG